MAIPFCATLDADTERWLTFHKVQYKDGWFLFPLPCENLTKKGKCMIYEQRPKMCKKFFCLDEKAPPFMDKLD